MDPEKSELLKQITDEANRQNAAGEIDQVDDYDEFIYTCLHKNAKTLWPDWSNWTSRQTIRIRGQRNLDAAKAKRHILKRCARVFRTFDSALSAAEFVNLSLLGECIPRSSPEEERPSLLHQSGHLHGIPTRNLILIGMQARMIAIGTEISALLAGGFIDAAAARNRTLYETSIKSIVIATDASPSQIELAERYYVSGILESKRAGSEIGEDGERLLAAARTHWGPTFFGGDNNWALPVMPASFRGRRVSFADLERIVGAQRLRATYLVGNQAIHAGAARVISDLDFQRRNPFTTGPVIDIYWTGYIGQSSAFHLLMTTDIIARHLATRNQQWDIPLYAIDFFKQMSSAQEQFTEIYKIAYSKRHDGSPELPSS